MGNSRFFKRELWSELYKAQEGFCIYCASPMKKEVSNDMESATLDHIKPKNKGGNSSPRNLALCCRKCNMDKSSEDLSVWWKKKDFFDETRLQFLIWYQKTLCIDLLSFLFSKPELSLLITKSPKWVNCLNSLAQHKVSHSKQEDNEEIR